MQQYLDVADQYRILIASFLQDPKVFLIGWIATAIILANKIYLSSRKDKPNILETSFMFFMCFALSAFWELGLLLLAAILILFVITFIVTLPSRILYAIANYKIIERPK